MNITSVSNTVKNNSISSNNVNESMETGDLSQTPAFIGKLVEQTLSKSILPRITSVMPLSVPSGFVYSLLGYYQGSDEDNKFENTRVVQLANTFAGTVNTNVTLSNSAVITVEHFEDKYAVIKIVSGTVVEGLTFTGNTIQKVYSTKLAVKKILKNYSLMADENTTPKGIGFKFLRTAMEVKTRKVNSVISQEAIQDIIAQYGNDATEMITNIMSSEVALEMDKEVIDYMKDIATIKSNLVLTNTNSADLYQAFRAISTKVNRELLNLSKKHGKNITGFIVCSSNVVAALISSGVMTFGESGSLDLQLLTDNSNVVGTMQQYVTVIQDKFSTDDYVLVGWKQADDAVNGKDGNAGVIFSPYNISMSEWTEPETGRIKKMIINRYGYQRNAFDEGGDTESDFFSIFGVDFTSLVGYTD